ncbi:hypothetical protein K435DRAFT_880722, partial [Dendrothele bispora CBS 962.96]
MVSLDAQPPHYSGAIPSDQEPTPIPYTPEPEVRPKVRSEAGPSKPAAKKTKAKGEPKRSKRKQRGSDESKAESTGRSESDKDMADGASGDDDDEEEEGLPHMLEPLAKEVDEMSVSDRRKKMRKLREMGKNEFERENTLAKNRALLKEVGVDAAMEKLKRSLPSEGKKKKGKGEETGKEKGKKEKGKKEKGKKKEQEKGKEKEKEQEKREVRTRTRSARIAAAAKETASTPMEATVGEPNDGNAMEVDPEVLPASADPASADPATANPVSANPASADTIELALPKNANEAIRALRTCLLKLLDTLEEAQDDDEITAHCYQEGPWSAELSAPDAWEHWNGVLDTVIQKRSTESVEVYESRLVKGGKKGTRALYRVLAHVMENVVINPDMLDGKIERVIGAIKSRCPEVTTPSAPVPSVPEAATLSAPVPSVPEVATPNAPVPSVPEVATPNAPVTSVPEVATPSVPDPSPSTSASRPRPRPQRTKPRKPSPSPVPSVPPVATLPESSTGKCRQEDLDNERPTINDEDKP